MPSASLAWDERGPVWEQKECWDRAAANQKILRADDIALPLREGDPRVRINFHDFRLAPQERLHTLGNYTFEQVRREFGFGEWDHWGEQREWLESLFRSVFPGDEGFVGTFSILSARRPSAFREQQDSTIKVTQFDARPHFLRRSRDLTRKPIILGDVAIPTAGLRLACESDGASRTSRVAVTVVPRRVQSSRFGIDEEYEEQWLCLADRDQEFLLREGKIPAVGSRQYRPDAVRVRTCPLLNLVRVTRNLSYCFLTVELQPESGEVLSIRWCRMPLSVAMLSSSPVEHAAVTRTLRD